MRAIFTLLLISMGYLAQAAAPTISTSNLTFSSVEGNSMTLSFTAGNGSSRIVIAHDGSAVVAVPANGSYPTANAAFGTPAAALGAGGDFVVYRGAGSIVNVTNLQSGHNYFFTIYEFNGANATTEYLLTPLSNNKATQAAPTLSASALSMSNITGNSAKLNFTIGNGTRRLIIGTKGNSISFNPTLYTSYPSSSAFGTAGAALGGGLFALGYTSGNNLTVTGLEPNTAYSFMVIELNGNSAPVYEAGSAGIGVTTNAGPTTNCGNASFSTIEGNMVHFGFPTGNGQYTLILARKGSPCQFVPANGATYTANNAYGSGQLVGPDEFVVGITNLNGITVTNLQPNTTYYFRMFSFDVTSAAYPYYLASSPGNGTGTTLSAPTLAASNLSISNVTSNSFRVNFTKGDGMYRMAVVKQGSPVDADPVDLSAYSYVGLYGSGSQLGSGNYTVASGNGSILTIGGLQAGPTYYVSVYEFNGSSAPIYLRPAATISYAMPNQPTVSSSNLNAFFNEGRSFRLNWTAGNGAKRIVIGHKGSAVTSVPVDGTTYNASASFGSGDQLNSGDFVVYNDLGSAVDLTNLDPASTYFFAVFEYNTSGGVPDYYPTPGTGSASTISAPTVNAGISLSNISSTGATINVTAGNGTSRLVVMRETAAAAADPADLTAYSYSTSYGTASAQLSTGNYIVMKSTNNPINQPITNLQPGTNYTVTVYELNGSSSPLYLRPGISSSFTTASNILAPTVPSANASQSNTDGDRFSLTVLPGNGSSRIVVMGTTPINFTPVDGTVYAANSVYGSSSSVGNGAFVVANNSSSSWNITGLSASTTYYAAIFEYNGSGSNIKYQSPGYGAVLATVSAPSTLATNLLISQPNATSLTIQMTAGGGSNRLIVVKDGGLVSGLPINGNVYTTNASFGNGSQLSAGEFVVSASNNTSVTVTGLISGHTYNVAVFEFNGASYPVYNINPTQGALQAGSPLPVTWKRFTAQAEAQAVLLDWSTLTETNTDRYVVERSADGIHFDAIGNVTAAGNSSVENAYRFTDAQPLARKSFYRLKQLDHDGRANYSVTVQLSRESSAFKIFPNPVHDVLQVQVVGQQWVQIANASGVAVKRVAVNSSAYINLSGLPAGVYYLRAGSDTATLLKD